LLSRHFSWLSGSIPLAALQPRLILESHLNRPVNGSMFRNRKRGSLLILIACLLYNCLSLARDRAVDDAMANLRHRSTKTSCQTSDQRRESGDEALAANCRAMADHNTPDFDSKSSRPLFQNCK
jgi:hypothetical protein